MTIPQGWAVTRFPEIADVLDSRRIPLNAVERARRRGEFAYYGANGLVDHVDDFLFDGPHVLLAEDGGHFDEPERGVAYAVDGRFWVNNHAHILRPAGGIDCGFLTAWLNATDWMPFVGGTTRAKLTQAGLSQPEVPLPPLAEQLRIVAKLDALTARTGRARADLDRVPALAVRCKQAGLAAAFRGGLTAEWRGGSHDETPSPSPGPWTLPGKWQWHAMADVGEVGLGRQRSPENHQGPNMRPYIRAANVTWGGLALDDVKAMNFDAADYETFKLSSGDVLINEGSGSASEVGKPAIWRGEIDDCCFQNTLLRVRPNLCSSEYLYYFLLYTARAGMLVKETQGVNIFHIGKAGLSRLQVPVPPRAEQAEIVRRLEHALLEIDRLAVEAAAARTLLVRLDQGLLAKAFRGELVPQDPADEPAAVLLDRIQAERAGAPLGGRRRRNARAA